MTVGDLGRRATAENLVTQSARFLLTKAEAEKIVSDMEAVVRSQWEVVARAAKVTVKDCGTICNALENEGFSFKAQEAVS